MKNFELIKKEKIFNIGISECYRNKKNNLKVILLKNDIAPVVTFHIWYNVGSKDEENKRTGLAHFLEHMMFRGTSRYKVGEFDKILDEAGSRGSNAFTSTDYTAYTVDLPSDSIELIIKLEADRMKNINITKEILDIERGAILSERALRVENDPYGYMWELLFSNLYKECEYNHDTIGWKKDIENITVKDLKDFYSQYYSPDNAEIVIVGDFNSENVLNLIEKHFSTIPRSNLNRKEDILETYFPNNLILRKEFAISTPKLLLGYKTVSFKSMSFIALKLFSIILSEMNSSLFKEKFLSNNKVIYIVSDILAMKNPGVFYIEADLKADENPQRILREIEFEILNLVMNLNNEKLDLAKTKFKIDKLTSFSSNDSIATALGESSVLTSSPYHDFELQKVVDNIKVDDIKKVVLEFLNLKKRVTIILEPKK